MYKRVYSIIHKHVFVNRVVTQLKLCKHWESCCYTILRNACIQLRVKHAMPLLSDLPQCHACVFYTDFLGRLLQKTQTFARARSDVKPETVLRSTTPERNDDSGRQIDRIASRRESSPDSNAQQKCEVLDHSVQWRLAASILDRFFFVVHMVALVCVNTWMGVRIRRRVDVMTPERSQISSCHGIHTHACAHLHGRTHARTCCTTFNKCCYVTIL